MSQLRSRIAEKKYIKNKEVLFIEPLDITMNDNDMGILIQKFIEDEWPKNLLNRKYTMFCKLINRSIFLKGQDFFYNILSEYKDKIKEEIEKNIEAKKTFINHIVKSSNLSVAELYKNGNEKTKAFLNEVIMNQIKADDVFLISRVLLLKQNFSDKDNEFTKKNDFIFKDDFLFYQDKKINLYPIFNEIMFNSGDLVFGDEETNPYIYYITKKIINFTNKNYKNIEEKGLLGLLHFLQCNIFNEKEYFKDLPQLPFVYVDMKKIENTHSKSEGYFIESALNFFLRGENDPCGVFNSYMENKELNEVIVEKNTEEVKQKIKRI